MSDDSNDKTSADMSAGEEQTEPAEPKEKSGHKKDSEPNPVRRFTQIVLCVLILLFFWHLFADRLAPYSDQGRVDGFVVPITPKVSGKVKKVYVDNNQEVQAGDLLLQIDPRNYEIEVQRAQAELDTAGQTIGVETASVKSAVADLSKERTQFNLARKDYERLQRIAKVDPGAVSKAKLDQAQSALARAETQIARAEAEAEKARQQLGKKGRDNPKIRAATAALQKAQIDLSETTIRAPSYGSIANLKIDIGHYAKAGVPIMTFISDSDVWIQANMRENSIGNLNVGDPVEILLDVRPGRVFSGKVVDIGWGVKHGAGSTPGELAEAKGKSGWLRDAQRIPVYIRFSDDKARGYRIIGGQADVQIYSGSNWLLHTLGWLWIRMMSVLSYAY